MIALVVMTDGRGGYLRQTIASFDRHVTGPVTRRIIHDDSADPGYAAWLARTYPTYEIASTRHRSGFGGAINSAWAYLSGTSIGGYVGDRFVFHLEDDFTFNRSVDLLEMAEVLDVNRHLAQMALRRQPCNDVERGAGGVVEQHPEEYTERRDVAGRSWLEHRLFYTTNPSLVRRSLVDGGWPMGPRSEGVFTHWLLSTDPDLRFGYWGQRTDPPWVEHIGVERTGRGY